MSDPVRIGDWCTLYHADATEILDVLREHAPDAVIMDPPYGLGLVGAGVNRAGLGTDAAAARGSPAIPGDREGADISVWMDVSLDVFTWGADHLRRYLPVGGRFVAWDKLNGMPAWDSFSDVEFGWHCRRGKSTIVSHLWKGLACDKRGEESGLRHHPMAKPVRVMQWCIEQCRLSDGSTILDPYMGSGTTGIAAWGMDMKFVGVEIERRWFDAAVARITERCDAGLFA